MERKKDMEENIRLNMTKLQDCYSYKNVWNPLIIDAKTSTLKNSVWKIGIVYHNKRASFLLVIVGFSLQGS